MWERAHRRRVENYRACGAWSGRAVARSTRTLYGFINVAMIRKATQDDRSGIYHVHKSAALQMKTGHYGAAELDAWINHLSPDLYEQPIATQEFVVAEIDGTIIGFGHLNVKRA